MQGTAATGADFVQELVDTIRFATGENEYVLASKYTNLFANSSVPILDQFAELMMGYHLDVSAQSFDKRRYHRFRADIETLHQGAKLACNVAQMDPYLWVRGEYLFEWQGGKKRVSKYLRPLFERVDRDATSEPLLAIILNK